MSLGTVNPFPHDAERAEIWTMLVHRDIDAFVAGDWSMVADDFVAEGFLGVDAKKNPNPDNWKISFPTLDVYRDEWLRQAAEFKATEFAEDARLGIFRATNLTEIELTGGKGVAHKKFDGTIKKADGTLDRLNWQTLYFLAKVDGRWKLTGFVGYMPNPLGA